MSASAELSEYSNLLNVKPDDWLGTQLGCPAYRLTVQSANSSADESVDQAIHTLLTDIGRQSDRHFIDAKIPAEQVHLLTHLQAAGFRVVDANFTLERRFLEIGTESNSPSLAHLVGRSGLDGVDRKLDDLNVLVARGDDSRQVRSQQSSSESQFEIQTISKPTPAETEQIVELAGRSFSYSRFHLDPQISNATADKIKSEWMVNTCAGNRGDQLFVAKQGETVVGFLSALLIEQNDAMIAIIDLIGVDESARGNGIGRQLSTEFLNHYRRRASVARVGTQIANLAAIRLYQSCGFHSHKAAYVLHYQP